MIAYQVKEFGKSLEKNEMETPIPQGTEVLLKTVACGVCHSDVHLHEGEFDLGNGKKLQVGNPGMILGHEILGTVVDMGPEAKGIAVGDLRVVYPWIGCGKCELCENGEEHFCNNPQNLGIHKGGGFGDHVLVPHAKYLFEKGNVPNELAATYACSGLTAYSALKKVGQMKEGDHLVVIGAGGVGMMGIQIAQSAFGIDPIVVDIDEEKLAKVKSEGINHVFNSKEPDVAKEIKKLTGGGAAVAIDFVGADTSVGFGLKTLRKGGKLIIVGLFGGALNFPIPFFPLQARIIEGSYVGSPQEMKELMALVRESKISPIQTETRPLSSASETLNDLKDGKIYGRAVLLA